MTREEFIENVQSWNDLLQFCYDEDCDYCEDVYDEDAKDDHFNENIVYMARDAEDWRDLYRQLEDIPTGYGYYINDDYGWHGADDDDFEEYKSDVLSWGDDNEVWDEDDDEDEWDEDALEEEYESDEALEEEEDEEIEEGCSLGELFSSSAAKLQTIEIETERERERAEQFFKQFISAAV